MPRSESSSSNASQNRAKLSDEEWLVRFGKHLERLIHERGYVSAYDFWLHASDEEISRASIHNAVKGKKDLRITTVRRLARLLGVDLARLFDF